MIDAPAFCYFDARLDYQSLYTWFPADIELIRFDAFSQSRSCIVVSHGFLRVLQSFCVVLPAEAARKKLDWMKLLPDVKKFNDANLAIQRILISCVGSILSASRPVRHHSVCCPHRASIAKSHLLVNLRMDWDTSTQAWFGLRSW